VLIVYCDTGEESNRILDEKWRIRSALLKVKILVTEEEENRGRNINVKPPLSLEKIF
jgi:hypothetical protein